MQSLNASSMFLHRSPSGVQRRIKQRLGNEWPVQKSTNLPNVNSSSTENLEPYEATTSSPNNSYNGHSDTNNLGYRSLIESSNYRSLLDDDSNSSIEPVEEKFSNWSLSNTQNKFSYLNGSSLSNSLNNALNTPTNTSFTVSPTKSPTKPTPLPRSHEQQQHVATPQSLALNGRQRHNSGLSSNLYNSSLPNDTSFGLSSTPVISKISLSTDLNGSQLPQSPIKPTVHVQPLSIPRVAKQQPPPVPEKPKSLQTYTFKER
ncbi:hypothetical protein M3Y97_00873500 [Aphelenchoides bicaudatus]|nr:hypothetical protein M3Y97_00873500 [Aphelenchoides bicaudatus]